MSIKVGDIVHIWVGDQLDEMARERYVQEKRRLNRVKRRRGLIPLPMFGEHTAGHGMSGTTATVVGTGAIAAGIAAAAIAPSILSDDPHPATRRPSVAAPAPTVPGPPVPSHPPASSPPGRPQTPGSAVSANPPVLPNPPVSAAPVSAPAHVPGIPRLHAPPPKLPAPPPVHVPPPPVVRQPRPLLTVSLSPAGVGARVWARPMLSVSAHVGSLQLRLGHPQP
ncbi:MAG: hypothetical protein JWO57_3217 [Pseudonocardiales bacterium]|nr:hypothetical protein [Pseudonocardiales bacterium]